MPAVVALASAPHRRARRCRPYHRGELVDGLVDHFASPLLSGALSARSSNSAESFPWTSITLLALSSSPSKRYTRWRSRAFSRSTWSTGGRPGLVSSAWSAPRSRCLRHSDSNEV